MSAADIRASLERAARAERLDAVTATPLLAARGADLEELLDLASASRDAGAAARGGDTRKVITYSRKVFIPLTTLCRDRCHYCTFVDTPHGLLRKGIAPYLEPEQVLAIAREGAAAGCREALFTLGDRPELRWTAAAEWLEEHGYRTTLEYLGAMARLVLEETGLLPHLNPGVLSWAEFQRLRPLAPSMGMMLETTSVPLWAAARRRALRLAGQGSGAAAAGARGRGSQPGPVHHGRAARHRGDAPRRRRLPRRHPRRARAVGARAGDDRAELPREAADRDAGRARPRDGPLHRRGRDRAPRAGAGGAPPGAAEPHRRGRARPADPRRHRRLGRRQPRHPRPREPGAAVAAPRRPRPAHGGQRLHAPAAPHCAPALARRGVGRRRLARGGRRPRRSERPRRGAGAGPRPGPRGPRRRSVG